MWKTEGFHVFKWLKEQKLVIAKILTYILTRDYNNSKTLKNKTNSLKLSGNLFFSLIVFF
jgi:hypothetical protein